MQIQCPKCDHKFTPPPGLVLAVNEDMYVKCPKCGERFRITPLFVRLEE